MDRLLVDAPSPGSTGLRADVPDQDHRGLGQQPDAMLAVVAGNGDELVQIRRLSLLEDAR